MSLQRVAVVQAGTTMFNTPKTLERMQAHCEELRRLGVQLAVFPEAYIGGYPKGLDFGARVGTRTAEGREDFKRYWEAAIDVPGPEVTQMGEMAKNTGAYLAVGAIERDGGTLYCAVLFFDPNGALIGKHRKLMPTASERLIWGMGDGSTIPVLDTPVGKIGAAVCWENYMPALRLAMYAKGINVWCAPTVDEREIWQASMRHIAYEGRCFVLCACQYLKRSDCPEDYACVQGNDPNTELIKGGSVIISPLGEVLAGPVRGSEAILTADIDLMDAIRGKYDLDASGHYARPEVFTLTVNEKEQRPVNIR
jgi:nitrilase